MIGLAIGEQRSGRIDGPVGLHRVFIMNVYKYRARDGRISVRGVDKAGSNRAEESLLPFLLIHKDTKPPKMTWLHIWKHTIYVTYDWTIL